MISALTDAASDGFNEQRIISITMRHISTIMDMRLPWASDEAILSYVEVMVDEIQELQDHGGDHCYRLLFPEVNDDIHDYKILSKEVQYRSLAAIDLTIKSYDAIRRIPSDEEVLQTLEPIYAELYETFGDDMLALDDPIGNNMDKERACEITKMLYLKILQLPDEQSVPVLRWLFVPE